MQEGSRGFTPPLRVLRFIYGLSTRFPRGVPSDRIIRHLKGDLTGLSFSQVDGALRLLEAQGLIRKEWDTPGEYRIFLTIEGEETAKQIEREVNPPPAPLYTPPVSGSPTTAAFVSPGPGQVVPINPAPTTSPSGSYPPTGPGPAAGPASGPSPTAGAPPTAFVQGRGPGPIPSKGPPASANLPVRILLYCLLYGADRSEADVAVPGEDLARYLLNQGFLLAEDYLTRLFAGLEQRELLQYLPRPSGGYDLRLTPRGKHLAEGLLSGQVALGGTSPTPPSAEAPAAREEAPPVASTEGPGADPLRERLTAAEAENADLRNQVESLKASLAETEGKRNQDRETLSELLHQVEVQEQQIRELQEALQRATGQPPAPAATPAPAEGSTDDLEALLAMAPVSEPNPPPEGEGGGPG